MNQQITATLRSTGRVWVVSIEGIEGTTLVRSPSHAPLMAAELAALHHGTDPSDYDVRIEVAMPEQWAEQWRSIQDHKEQARRHREAWRREAHSLVTAMRHDGFSQADAAVTLGVSTQTIRTWESLDVDGPAEATDD